MNEKRACGRIGALLLAMIVLLSVAAQPVAAAKIKGKTGIGMAEWAFKAYNEGWTYSYGGSSAGKVDCSGLIRSYCNGKGGGARALLDASSVNGSTSDMPRIHGLGLWCEGHAGVYVGKNKDGVDMAIDMRNSRVNVVYSSMKSRYYSPWKKWFKIDMISYPDTGWYEFRGNTYYYKNGEFCVGTVKIDGKTYDFGKSGVLKGEIDPNTPATTTQKTTTTKATTTASTTTSTTTTTTTATTTTVTTTTTTTTTTQAPETTTRATTTTTRYSEPETTTQVTTKATEKTTKSERKTTSTTTAKKTTSTRSSAKKTTSTTTSAKKTTTTGRKSTTSQKTSRTTSKTTSKTGKTNDNGSTTATTTSRPTTTTTTGYRSYEGGMRGETVSLIQRRLYELGYYDQDITDYYGPFTRDAIKAFQKALGVLPTGIADEATQKALFAEDAPIYSEDNSLMNSDEYQLDEKEPEAQEEEKTSEQEAPVIVESVGIGSLSMTANPYNFTRSYGESGPLQTMGVFSYQSPSVMFYRGGESYEVTEEMMEALDNCVFM